MMYGPNTNLGHNSIIFMIECQTRYIVDCIRALRERDLAWLDLRREVMDAYNADAAARARAHGVGRRPTSSWYKNADGRITNNWSGTTIRYWWKTRRADLASTRSCRTRDVRSCYPGGSPSIRLPDELSLRPAIGRLATGTVVLAEAISRRLRVSRRRPARWR